jgi:hypothetical protein
MVATILVSAAPALAETDTLGNQCISVGGVRRACLENAYAWWGSGISWQIGGRLYDMNGGDGWVSTMEYSLDRKWSSNTPFMAALRVGNWQSHNSWRSGSDPTYGAWIRLCTTSPSGIKWCNPTRYATDQS